ncbi:hypothetical protein [Leucobacter sp. NPDC077196]|uniref:hypothetical protein n=1 Tax=Leucobacter sp. NPDC077196 TaxID=3154959 RepID=UPI0034451815
MERGLGGEQRVVRLVVGEVYIVVAENVHVAQKRLVESASYFMAGFHVDAVGVLEECELGVQRFGTFRDVNDNCVALSLEPFAFFLDAEETALDLGRVDRAVCGEVEKVLFFLLKLRELASEVLAEVTLCLILVIDGVGHDGANLGEELRAEWRVVV